MKSPFWLVSLVTVATLTGCVNLGAVREFAGQSAKLTAYETLTNRYLETGEREGIYAVGKDSVHDAAEFDRKLAEAKDTLLGLHTISSNYFATLATLAGDDSFRIDKQLDQIGKNMKTVSVPNLNLKPETVDAAVRIGKAISDVVLGAAQEAAVRRFLKDTGPAADKLFSGMVEILGDMRATNAQEKANVVGFLDIEVRQQRSHGQWLIAALAADREHVLSAEYQKVDEQYAQATRGMQAVVEGHRALMGSLDKLNDKGLKTDLKRLRKDIQAVRDSLGQ